jgi:hypothetical protein
VPKQRKRSGIARAPKRIWSVHEEWVRSLSCIVPGCRRSPCQFCHVRSAANAGTGLKPFDSFGVPMCALHHSEQHRIGQPAFQIRYHLDLFRTAAAYFRQSPDHAMQEALKDVATQYVDPEFY